MIRGREMGMGATDVVEVAGLSPYQDAGPWRVYNAKTGVTQPEDEEVTEEQAWGHEVERFLRGWYAHETKLPWAPCPRIPSKRHDWLWATPDGRAASQYVELDASQYVEIKNVGSFMAHHWDRSNDDGIPHYVRGQVTLGMYCAEVREWTVIAAIGGLPPRIYHVEYDLELAERLVQIGRTFWEGNVLARVPPLVDASDACKVYMQSRWPKDVRPMVEATVEIDDIGKARIGASLREARAVAEKKLADAKLLEYVGDARGVIGDGWKFTNKVGAGGVRRSRFTAKDSDE